MANAITTARIFFSVGLLFTKPFSLPFYLLYLFAGLSDMIDGWVARKTHTESETGAKLDTFSDFIFVAVCLAKILPILHFSAWVWLWIAIIALIRINNAYLRKKFRHQAEEGHTFLNKVTGFCLFVFVLVLPIWKGSVIPLCVLATYSALQEGWIIINDQERL